MENWNKTSFTELISDRTKDGIKLPTNEYNQSGLTAIIDQGQEFIAGYSDETEGAFTDVPAIIFGDHTRVFKYVDFPFFLGADGVKVLKANQEINYKYLYYYFLQAKFPNTGYARHFKWLKELQIPLPPLETQENIAAVLDKCTALIAKHKLMLEKYDTLIKSRFIEMFGDLANNTKKWIIKNFTECAIIDTKMVKDFEKYADYPHIGIDSIEKETGVLSGYRTVKEDNVISGKYLFTPEHIIYSKIRPNLNKVAMPNFNGLCSADAYPILVKNNITTREYLTYVMRSDFYVSYILAFSRRANMPKVNKEQVESFNLPLPPYELQKQFSSFVQQIDKSKFAVQKSLEKTEILYKSLMQAYFG